MIYKSKEKVQDMIENYNSRFPTIKGGTLGDRLEIEIPDKSDMKKAISILKKKGIYHEDFCNDFSLGHYYVINGNMFYICFEAGNIRKLEDGSFIERLSEGNFFADDWLIFQILLDFIPEEERRQIYIKCVVGNLECFTGQSICNRMIFSKNTLDPGILEKEIPITGVMRIDDIDEETGICYGNPLYLEMNYD